MATGIQYDVTLDDSSSKVSHDDPFYCTETTQADINGDGQVDCEVVDKRQRLVGANGLKRYSVYGSDPVKVAACAGEPVEGLDRVVDFTNDGVRKRLVSESFPRLAKAQGVFAAEVERARQVFDRFANALRSNDASKITLVRHPGKCATTHIKYFDTTGEYAVGISWSAQQFPQVRLYGKNGGSIGVSLPALLNPIQAELSQLAARLSEARGGEEFCATFQQEMTAICRPVTVDAQGFQAYRLQRGDSLSAVARKFGTSVSELRRANCIQDPDDVDPNAVLAVPIAPTR